MFATATGVLRLTGGRSDDLPRLCLGAACRAVERMANNPAGHDVARTAAFDLRLALQEALTRTQQLIDLIDHEDLPTV